MTTPDHHRSLSEHLRGWTAEQVATLLERRPELVFPDAPTDLVELARRAQHHGSLANAIAATTLPENRLLQLVVCCRPDVTVDELAAALPAGVGLDDIEPLLSSLEASAMVWRQGGRIHCSESLRHTMPTTLGPPLRGLLERQTVDYLKSAIRLVRTAVGAAGFAGTVPEPATGPDGRPPRKVELIGELESLLVVPGLVDAVLATGSDECAGIAAVMADGSPAIVAEHPMYFASYANYASYYHRYPTYWLFERALLLPIGDDRTAVQPREVGVALRGGRPVEDLAIDPPALVTGPVEPASVDASAAARVVQTLDRLGDLLEAWEQAPVKALKSGALGVAIMKQTAAALGTDLTEAARLVELAHLAGLIESTTVNRKEKRKYVRDTFAGPSPAASAWIARPLTQRWRQLATAWLRSEHWPSATGGTNAGAKAAPVLSPQYAPVAPDRRRDVLDVLASLDAGAATGVEALAAYVYWQRPQPWRGQNLGYDRPERAIAWVYAEAELLGVVATGALSRFGRALLAGDDRGAERAFEAARPEAVTTFTLQGDLTATVVGMLDRDVAVELRLLADVESTGAATTFRFSDASLRRALDAGVDGDAILAFLETHATKGVPKALGYLVNDVARRYGHLQVGPAGSFVTSEDPAVLADACSHRRTRKLALRVLAPTVAVSPQPSAKVIDGLRAAGFLPTGDGSDQSDGAPVISVGGQREPDPGGPGRPRRDLVLPEPFQSLAGRCPMAPPVDAPTAARLAEAIVAGRPPASTRSPTPPSGGPPALPLVFGDGEPGDSQPNGPLDELLEWAFDNGRVLAIALGDPDDPAEPMLVAITGWRPGAVVGIDLADGTTMSILAEHIAIADDVGAIDDLISLSAVRADRAGSASRPSRSQGRRR